MSTQSAEKTGGILPGACGVFFKNSHIHNPLGLLGTARNFSTHLYVRTYSDE